MLRRTNVVWLILVIAVLVATGATLGTGEGEVRQLLLLMDTDKNGKISKQEWMKFMEAEFDRLDVEKNGELGVKEIAQSRLRASYSAALGKEPGGRDGQNVVDCYIAGYQLLVYPSCLVVRIARTGSTR